MALRADDVDLSRDRALVMRFQAGDQAAFEDLYRRYFVRLRRYCERRVGDPHEAEEVAQDAFVRALRALPGFAGERRFYPWMTVIASRLCVDSHRRRERSTPMAEVDAGAVDADLDRLFAEVDRAHLARALSRISPRHREVLSLREHEGWSYQHIADHYGVTLGTVEALLHRARRSLRREFERLTASDRMRALVGIPGVAWVLRRVEPLRVRTAQLSNLASPLSAAVASVVLAAGSVAVVDARAGDAPAPRAATVTVDRPRLTSAASALPLAAPPAPPLPTFDAPPDSAGEVRDPRVTTPRVDVARADDGRARTADAPLREDIDGIGGAAVDPAAVVADVRDAIEPVLRRKP